jgi:hypothetical protein
MSYSPPHGHDPCQRFDRRDGKPGLDLIVEFKETGVCGTISSSYVSNSLQMASIVKFNCIMSEEQWQRFSEFGAQLERQNIQPWIRMDVTERTQFRSVHHLESLVTRRTDADAQAEKQTA